MSIRAKLFAAIVITAIVPIVLTAIALNGMSTLDARFADAERAARGQELALDLKFGVTDLNGWQTAWGYDDGESRPRFDAAVRAFRRDLAVARARFTDPGEQRLVEDLAAGLDQFMALDARAWSALQNNRPEVTKRILLGPEIRQFEAMAATAQALADREAARVRASREGFAAARRDARRKMVTVALGAGALIVLLLVTAGDVARLALERERERETPA